MYKNYVTLIFVFGLILVLIYLLNKIYATQIDLKVFNKELPKDFKKNNIEFRLEVLQNTILFYTVLFFTCVVGIIELIPVVNTPNTYQCSCWLQLLYFGMVLIIDFCIFRIWGIFVESALLTRASLEDWKPYKEYTIKYASIFDKYILCSSQSKGLVTITLLIITTFFILLFNSLKTVV